MEWLWWIPIIYLVIGIPFGIHESRTQLKQLLRNEAKYWYEGDGSPRRTDEERIRYVASLTFWPGIFIMCFWPGNVLFVVIGKAWDLIAEAIAIPELKAARKQAEDAKTQEILARLEEEEKKKFDGL